MSSAAQQALKTIRRCIDNDRVIVLPHFTQRMDQRGLFWSDVLTVLEQPKHMRADGFDDWGRSRWIIAGQAGVGVDLSMVCVLGQNDVEQMTVFVTLYWVD